MEPPAAAASGDADAGAAPPSRLTIVRVKRRRTEAAQETLSARPTLLSFACRLRCSPAFRACFARRLQPSHFRARTVVEAAPPKRQRGALAALAGGLSLAEKPALSFAGGAAAAPALPTPAADTPLRRRFRRVETVAVAAAGVRHMLTQPL
jgi:hypothetical protein